jgi:hypothetical protein
MVGSFAGAVASKKVTEACKGRFKTIKIVGGVQWQKPA